MTKAEAAEIIDTIRQSLEREPGQFHFAVNLNVTGFQSTSHGGIGTNVSVVGGGAGSKTIGLQSSASVDNMQIEIAKNKAVQVVNEQHLALINSLNEIAAEFRAPQPDQSKLTRLYESITKTWVPSVIGSVIGNLITMAMMVKP
jgi:hypothetical protein